MAQTQPNGQWQYNAYDDLGRLESGQTYTSADALQAQFLWTYDAVGNVTVQSERWPGEGTRGAGWRSTVMVYDATNRLTGEAMAQPGSPVITTGYAYDTGSNRSVKLVSTDGTLTTQTLYTYNHFNQLTDWSEEDGLGTVTRTADLTYDLAGNRATQTLTVTGQSAETTTYHWDAENRLEGVTLPNADEHEYGYDYRTRRISRVENGIGTAIVFSGGLSVAEYESQGITPTVEYLRGPDMGGGVGGMMYSLRNGGTEAKYAMSNGRGDVVAQSNDAGALTWTASYEAYGKRPVETGTNLDRQRANTKEEDPTGLLNEGFRYRDIETGVWLSRDPAGFVDGPNLYAYVRQNPWTSFDPKGLALLDLFGSKETVAASSHLAELDAMVNQASKQLQGFVPQNPNNPGEFGSTLDAKVGELAADTENIHYSVVVKEESSRSWGLSKKNYRIVSMGEGAGGTGTTEIDLMKTAKGYRPRVGDILDRDKVLAAIEIKSSLDAAKAIDFGSGGQGSRLAKLFNSKQLAVSVPNRTWTPTGWKTNVVAGAGIAFAVLGFGQQVHAINNINNYEGQLNEVLTAASVYRTSVEQGDGDAMLMNKTAFISKVSGYMGNFVDGLSAGLVGEAAMRAAVSDWSSN